MSFQGYNNDYSQVATRTPRNYIDCASTRLLLDLPPRFVVLLSIRSSSSIQVTSTSTYAHGSAELAHSNTSSLSPTFDASMLLLSL